MNIIDAVKSGKRLRLPTWKPERWLSPGDAGWFYPEDILSNEWEIDEEKIEITKSQLFFSLNKMVNLGAWDYNSLAKDLGFK